MQQSNQTPNEVSAQALNERKSRRSLLKGAIIGAAGTTGLVVAGAALLPHATHAAHAASASAKLAAATCTPDQPQDILNIAATAEQLAVTFYTNGIQNAKALNISGQNLNYLTGAVEEEQYHLNVLLAAGAKPLTGTFSFPNGATTFTHLHTFVKTLDMLETAFESAYIAAIRDFVLLNAPDYAVLAAQIATIEAENRALGRSIDATINTANNWAFTPVYVKSVGDAVNVLSAEGFLSPSGSNSYQYAPASLSQNTHVYQTKPYVVACS